MIILTAVVLVGAQVYFTIQNYRVNQQRFVNDVQIALDLSVEKYFSDQARTNIQVFTMTMPDEDTTYFGHHIKATVSSSTHIDSPHFSIDTLDRGISYKWAKNNRSDSIWVDSIMHRHNTASLKKISIWNDSAQLSDTYSELTKKVMLSFSEDLIDIGKLYEAVDEELERKNLKIDFALMQKSGGRETKIGEELKDPLSTVSKSSYLGRNRNIRIDFENATLPILRRGLIDLTLSILIVGLVIGTMLYLFQTINRQKQLAEIKDDLISNITHEFKTPIATIFSALEGVTNFNEANDQAKTKKYLAISNDQLKKLNATVEKLLETATIDKGKLKLSREDVELVGWTRGIVDRFTMVSNGKEIALAIEMDEHLGSLDVFHFENALANLIDNAIKYGGNNVTVRLYQSGEKLIWEVEDNGGDIPKHARERIFEKLYRVPKGNTHDVKGFGIGLYYARTIAELHDGQLTLEVGKDKTLFKLIL